MPTPRPLYRLPELTQVTGGVAVVEGEKCSEILVDLRAWHPVPKVFDHDGKRQRARDKEMNAGGAARCVVAKRI